LELDPNEPDSWVALAQLQFQMADFDGARDAALRCLDIEPCADAVEVLSRLAERDGDVQRADELAERANTLDPECLIPIRVSESEFQALVQKALDDIPERFRAALEGEVAIIVEPVPSAEILKAETPPMDPELLGLYVGTPLPERDQPTAVSPLPDRIYLFQRNLEHVADNRDDLVEQIRITLFHEVGHYFGFTDEELEKRDFG
jgi:predicted Zn-dependent protease with MMP-like domain